MVDVPQTQQNKIKKCFVIGRFKCIIGEKELKKKLFARHLMYYYDLLLTANGFINQRIFLDSCRNGSSRSLGSQAQISSTKFICYQCSSILTHCTRNYYTIVPSCCVSSSISSITITTTKPLKNASLQKNLFRIKVCSHHQSVCSYPILQTKVELTSKPTPIFMLFPANFQILKI